MIDTSRFMTRKARLGLGGAVLVALGAAGGAGAAAMTLPRAEMAPATPVAVASLPQRQGIVTVRGRIAEKYGNQFVIADGSGRTMVDAGRDAARLTVGAPVTVQGRYDDGQLHASFLVDPNGTVEPVGPRRGPGRDGPPPPPPGGPGRDGPPPPPPGGPGAPPPPPGGPGAPPPPPGGAGAPPPPAGGCAPAGMMPPPPPPAAGQVPPPVAGQAPAPTPVPTAQPRT